MGVGEGSQPQGAVGTLVHREGFYSLVASLYQWRADPDIKLMTSTKSAGRVLDFVKGLRLSSQVIYLLRDVLSGSGFKVNWGHLIDDQHRSCSPECDAIVHRGHIRRWNDHDEPGLRRGSM